LPGPAALSDAIAHNTASVKRRIVKGRCESSSVRVLNALRGCLRSSAIAAQGVDKFDRTIDPNHHHRLLATRVPASERLVRGDTGLNRPADFR
jgi:hypothetical protein